MPPDILCRRSDVTAGRQPSSAQALVRTLSRTLVRALALLMACLLVSGCQNVTHNKASDDESAAAPQSSEGKAVADYEEYDEAGAAYADESKMAASSAAEPGKKVTSMDADLVPSSGGRADDQEPAKPRPDRMIVYQAWLTVVVHKVDETLKAAETLVEDSGGYVESSTRNSRVLRIPSQRYHEIMAELKKLGEVRHIEQKSQDITEQFTNLVARIQNLQALEKRYQELLAQAKTLKDRLAIERELRRISKELEQLQAQRRAMKNLADFATVELTVEQKQSEMVAQRDRQAQPFGWVRGYGLTGVLQ